MKSTLKTLTTALALAMGAVLAVPASAGASDTAFKATQVQYRDYDRRDYDRRDYDRRYDRGRDYDRDGIRDRYDRDRDRDNDGIRNRWDRNDYSGRGGYYRSRYRAWDWDGDRVPNRYDRWPRNPWRW